MCENIGELNLGAAAQERSPIDFGACNDGCPQLVRTDVHCGRNRLKQPA
jgi:hypothetical protein